MFKNIQASLLMLSVLISLQTVLAETPESGTVIGGNSVYSSISQAGAFLSGLFIPSGTSSAPAVGATQTSSSQFADTQDNPPESNDGNAVPEPLTLTLMGAGGAYAFWRRRRK